MAKRHSTRAEALSVANGMRAYRTVLTHLSQRYSRHPMRLLRDIEGQSRNGATSIVAFDLMAINLADLCILPEWSILLAQFFEHEDELAKHQEVMSHHIGLSGPPRLSAQEHILAPCCIESS